MSLDRLIIKPASEAQAHEAHLRSAAHWGTEAGVAVDDFMKLFPILQQGVYARDGRLKYWVLVSKDDPESTNFYASCQVLTRDVMTLHPGQTSPNVSFGHSVAFVLVPPEHRGKGYANRLMSLLHSVLAPHRYPNHTNAPTVSDYPSTVSILYSIVGNFYARCGPSAGESGWDKQSSLITTWPLANVKVSPSKISLPPADYLSESQVTETLDSDDLNIPADLLQLQKKNPTKTYFAFVPTAHVNAYSVAMSGLASNASPNAFWGARIPGSGDFITWVIFPEPGLKLIVTRLRATTTSFPALLDAALRVAQGAQCECIEIWNVPKHLNEVIQATGGVTTEEVKYVHSFKWYGEQPGAARADAVWALEERYNWC